MQHTGDLYMDIATALGCTREEAKYEIMRRIWSDPKVSYINHVHPHKPLVFKYENHRGEVEVRHVSPKNTDYGICYPWYPEPTWLMRAWDIDRGADRIFDMTKMDFKVYNMATGENPDA